MRLKDASMRTNGLSQPQATNLSDRHYSSRVISTHLRSRGITAVMVEPADRIGDRERCGVRGGGSDNSMPPITGTVTSSNEAFATSNNGGPGNPPRQIRHNLLVSRRPQHRHRLDTPSTRHALALPSS